MAVGNGPGRDTPGLTGEVGQLDDTWPGGAAWDDPLRLAVMAASHGPDLVLVADPSGVVRFAGGAAQRILGLDPAAAGDAHLLHFVHPADGAAVLAGHREATVRAGYHRPVNLRIRRNDDTWVDCEVASQSVEGPDGMWLVLSLRDICDRREIADRRDDLGQLILSASLDCARARWYEVDDVVEHLLRSLAGLVGARDVELAWTDGSTPEAALVTGAQWAARPEDRWEPDLAPSVGEEFQPLVEDPDAVAAGLLLDLGDLSDRPGAKRHLDAGLDAVVELDLALTDPRARVRLGFVRESARWEPHNSDLVALLATILLSTLRRCRAEEQLNDRARRDPLTGLFNRNELFRVLRTWVAAPRQEGRIGVLYCDIDSFKETNDGHGHAVGDDVLRAVAAALQESVREGDVVARFGGDEFVAVCRDLESPDQLLSVARRVESTMTLPECGAVGVGVSVGTAMWQPGLSAEELIGRADAAMYDVKRGRRARR